MKGRLKRLFREAASAFEKERFKWLVVKSEITNLEMVAVQGFEPRTQRIWAACSDQLSYTAFDIIIQNSTLIGEETFNFSTVGDGAQDKG